MTATPTLSVPTSTLVTAEGLELPLRATTVRAVAHGGQARVRLIQTFANEHDLPLEVHYNLPLPADAAVAGFVFVLHEQRIEGTIQRKEDARQTYADALFEGRSAALLESVRDGLFSQKVGHVPPNSEVQVEIELDQPLTWEGGQWCWRFPTVVAPRYVDAAVTDAADVAVAVADAPLPARLSLELGIEDAMTGPVSSPSHVLSASGGQVRLMGGAARLDRDVVVRWPVAEAAPGVVCATGWAAGERFADLTLVPPALNPSGRSVARDLIVLLDISGSMGGEPLAQAVAVTEALISSLGPDDSLELLAFGSQVVRWTPRAMAMDATGRANACTWLRALRAHGGTCMDAGIREALTGLRADAQRQVLLVTDGHIGFEKRIVGMVAKGCGTSTRLHVLGVGHGVNRSLTRPASLAGRGHEEIIAPGEPPEPALTRLLQRMDRPVVVDVVARCGAQTVSLPDLYAGWPSRHVLPITDDPVVLQGRTVDGPWQHTLEIDDAQAPRPDLGRRYGRQRVAELDLAAAQGESTDAMVELLGMRFGIVTSMTSFVAVSEHVTVDPTAPTRAVTVAQDVPAGMSMEGLGLAKPVPARPVPAFPGLGMAAPAPSAAPQSKRRAVARQRRRPSLLGRLKETVFGGAPADKSRSESPAPPPMPPKPASAPEPLEQERAAVEELDAFAELDESRLEDATLPLALALVRSRVKDGMLWLKLMADGDWRMDEVEVLQGGRWVPARVVSEHCTPAQLLAPGSQVTLVLWVSGTVDAVRVAGTTVTLP